MKYPPVHIDPRAVEVLKVLNEKFGEVIIAGGAARDTAHGIAPKDYDLCMLTAGASDVDNYEDYAYDVSRALKTALPLVEGVEVFETYRSNKGRLIFCIKFKYKELSFDLLEYGSQPVTPEDQVAEFDTTLNMVWLALEADDSITVNGTDAFHAVVTQAAPVQPLRSIDGDIPARLEYLKGKFPNYEFSEIVYTEAT